MREADKRLLRRVVVALALGLACGWIGLSLLERSNREPPAEGTSEPVVGASPDSIAEEPEARPATGATVDREKPEVVRTAETVAPTTVAHAPAPRHATLRARMVAEGAKPLENVPALLVPRDPALRPRSIELWKSGQSDSEGRIEFRDLELGDWIVSFTPESMVGARYEVELPPGVTDLGDVDFGAVRELHDLAVRLEGPGFDLGTRGMLHLWSLDDGATDRWTTIGAGQWIQPSAERNSTRTFTGLPAGRHALSFQQEDRAAEPLFREFTVPCDPIVFELGEGGLPLRVIAGDGSGRPLPAATFVVLTDRHAPPHVVAFEHGEGVVGPDPGLRWRWALLSNGFVPRMGLREDFRIEEGELVLRATLDAGHGAVVLARDADTLLGRARGDVLHQVLGHLPALPGVELSVGGRTIAKTDEDGFATCVLPGREAPLELSADGRAIVDVRNLTDGLVVNGGQLVLVRLAR